jgi:hypothetical protein
MTEAMGIEKITGTGDPGKFSLTCAGSSVESIEGLR